jgi:HD-like signal output (HDOD) protein
MKKLPPININPKTFLYKHCTLPALPAVLTKIQENLFSEEVNLDKISDLIMKDAALTSQILKIVNSAYYSLPMEIDKVKVAVAYLGINEIHHIVLSFSVINVLVSNDQKVFNEIWFHSLYTAICARELTRKYEPLLNTAEVWTSALLHDIGKLVYLRFFPEHYKMLSKYAEKNGCFISEAEKELSFPTSSYLGSLLCNRWGLPHKIKDSCLFHTLQDLKPDSAGNSEADSFIRIIILSNLIATVTTNRLRQEKVDETKEAVKDALGLNEADLLILLNAVSKFKNEATTLL